MRHTGLGLVVLIIAVIGLTAVGATALAQDGGDQTLGGEVSAFMQTSAADADATVEDGMFEAEFDSAAPEERPAVVENRTDRIQQRLTDLEDEYAELKAANDSMNPVARNARLSAVAMRIDRLEGSINQTESKAVAVGVDVSALNELRRNASNLTGPEVAEIARGLAGVDPPRGPPDDVRGPPEEPGPSDDSSDADETGDNDEDEDDDSAEPERPAPEP